MTSTTPEVFHAAVWPVPAETLRWCECGAPAAFQVGCADTTGARVAEALQPACPRCLPDVVAEVATPV